jgi:hypothetical protein
MKKILTIVAAGLLVATMMTSCKSTEKTCNYTYAKVSEQEVAPNGIHVRPLLADIDLGVRFTYTCVILRDNACGRDELENIKAQARHKCMAERKIDFIINPEYLITMKDDYANVSIIGRDATYTNVRPFDPKPCDKCKKDEKPVVAPQVNDCCISIPEIMNNYDHFSIEINHSPNGSGIINVKAPKHRKHGKDAKED